MARKKAKPKTSGFIVFNVTYEDGMVTSNRRIPMELLDQSFGDSVEDLAMVALKDQDDEIARRSNQPRAEIKSIAKV